MQMPLPTTQHLLPPGLNQGINLSQLNAMVSMGQLGSLSAMNQQIQQLQQLQQQLTGQTLTAQLPLPTTQQMMAGAMMSQLQNQLAMPSMAQLPPNPYYAPPSSYAPPQVPLSQVNYRMVPPIYLEQEGQYYQPQPTYDQSQQQQYQMVSP